MATTPEKEAVPQKKGKGIVLLLLVGVLAAGAGFSAPHFLSHEAPKKSPPVESDSKKAAVISFGDVTVNLGEDRLVRMLRVKILLAVDGSQEKAITDELTKQKAFMKNWLIGYLSDLTLQEVGRNAGVNRLRREIREQFNAMLWPDGRELIQEVLFDEFIIP